MDQKKIGSLLKKLRNEKGLTQEQFAEMVNVSNRTVYQKSSLTLINRGFALVYFCDNKPYKPC